MATGPMASQRKIVNSRLQINVEPIILSETSLLIIPEYNKQVVHLEIVMQSLVSVTILLEKCVR